MIVFNCWACSLHEFLLIRILNHFSVDDIYIIIDFKSIGVSCESENTFIMF